MIQKIQFNILSFIIFILFAGLVGIVPAKKERKLDIDKFIEEFSRKDRWILMGEPQLLTGSNLLEAGQGFVEYLAEFQIKQGFSFSVVTQKDSIPLNIIFYEAPSQVFAFGLYSVEKSPSLKFFDIGFESFLLGRKLVSWYGKFVIITENSDSIRVKDKYVKEISQQIIRLLPKQKRHNPILDALPDKNRVKHSEKFYLQHWLDQEYFRNIYYADYYTAEGYSRIFIINNETTASADSNFWRYFSFIKQNTEILTEDLKIETDYFIVDEPLWGKVILTKKNQIIYGILDYRNKSWTEDRLSEVLNLLKKKKVVKSG